MYAVLYHLIIFLSASESSDIKLFASLDEALAHIAASEADICRSFVIGGAQLYLDLIQSSPTHGCAVETMLVTRLLAPTYDDCDAFFPEFRTKAQIEDDFRTIEQHKLPSPTTDLKDKTETLKQEQWSKRPLAEFKQYLGSACPPNLRNRDDMIVQEEDTWYEYQMWQRSDL